VGQDSWGYIADLRGARSGIFFAEGLDKQCTDKRSDLPVGQINQFFSSLRANGPRECAPDDRLREAIHRAAKKVWIASSLRSSQ
jgi:hypothetical protein